MGLGSEFYTLEVDPTVKRDIHKIKILLPIEGVDRSHVLP